MDDKEEVLQTEEMTWSRDWSWHRAELRTEWEESCVSMCSCMGMCVHVWVCMRVCAHVWLGLDRQGRHRRTVWYTGTPQPCTGQSGLQV